MARRGVGSHRVHRHLWPKGRMWAEGESWAQQLQKHWVQRPVKSSVQDLDGIYTAVSFSPPAKGH